MILPLLLAMAAAEPAEPEEPLNDVYMGTLVVNLERPAVVLARCDLGNTLYVLRDGKGSHAVADLLKAKPSDAPLYGEVIGSYQEEKGVNVLTVSTITGLKRGKDCHLLPVSETAVGDADFTGHYYLSGVHEVGSELLLRADGHFEWMMAYGASDNAATGHWAQMGKTIVLTAEKPSQDQPLFALGAVRPWDEEAETRLLTAKHNAEERKVFERCPFLTSDDVATTPPPMLDPAQPPSAEVLKARAAQALAKALAKALAARAKVEALAQKVMAQPDSGQKTDDIRAAVSDWNQAHDAAMIAASNAGQSEVSLDPPKLPAGCALPPDAAPGKTWIGGKAVAITTAPDGKGYGVDNVGVTMILADGHRMELTTDRDGFAYLSNDNQPGAITALMLKSDGREQRFDLSPMDKGILTIAMDTRQLVEPAFTTLTLTIDGQDLLLGEEMNKGRYHREP